ncbi:hypothetical protein [Nocardioides marmotae]|uniref:hypothetical protein n=1 Tax=Nocardioides marmotae TaxID=2663857 RepID=UPI0012B5F590|nr:hypothetical protein [Nocardioides marmotae]MBC9732412.1 hypothetical protein [Nocardioides marmotae]MTB83532.1 hypothetical protein [Nocardioides marmotae]
MPTPRRLRALVALPAAALLASVVTVTGPAAAPAVAEPGCLSEAVTDQTLPGLLGRTCDDEVPPVVDAAVTVTPTPQTAQSWVSSKQLTFAFAGRHTDADLDPLGFECQFFASSTVPTTWTACGTYDAAAKVWKQSYADLAETEAQPYTFRVRAVDTGDAARDPRSFCGLGCQAAETDVDDVSAPATVAVRVDTVAPAGSVRVNGLVDEENPDWPMVTSRTLQVVLGASGSQERSPLGFSCTLNQAPVPCSPGTTDLRSLPPGDQRFEATARDAAGNVDPTPAVLTFSVPRNLTARKGSGWKTVRQGGYFGNDFLQTTKVGAVVSMPGKNVRELRLIAPRGPKLGKVQVKIGQSIWRTVNLKAPTYKRFHVYQIRDQFDPLVSGTIQVRAKKIGRGETVRIDAVLAH